LNQGIHFVYQADKKRSVPGQFKMFRIILPEYGIPTTQRKALLILVRA